MLMVLYRNLIGISCFSIIFLSIHTFAQAKPEYSISFSAQQSNGLPLITNQTQFDCSDQIYTIIIATNLADKPIEATLIWKNPAAEIQEKTPVNLYPVEGKAQGWAWLKLHKTTGAAMLSFLDDSMGMEDFIGDWQIELLINNNRVAKSTFNVLC